APDADRRGDARHARPRAPSRTPASRGGRARARLRRRLSPPPRRRADPRARCPGGAPHARLAHPERHRRGALRRRGAARPPGRGRGGPRARGGAHRRRRLASAGEPAHTRRLPATGDAARPRHVRTCRRARGGCPHDRGRPPSPPAHPARVSAQLTAAGRGTRELPMTFLRHFTPLILLLAAACGRGGAGGGGGPAANDAAVSQRVVDYFQKTVTTPGLTFKVTKVEDSEIPDWRKGNLEVSLGQQTQNVAFYVSRDGRYLFRGDAVDLTVDPLKLVRDKIKLDGEPSRGPADAKVTIVEYSDFQCPFCSRVYTTVESQVLKEYGDKV